jgi:hypothetical protein
MAAPKKHPEIRVWCSTEVKEAFAAAASAQDLSQSELFRRLVGTLTGVPVLMPAPAVKHEQVLVRLTPDERKAGLARATAEGRTLPSWIRSILRRIAFRQPVFAAAELDALRTNADLLRRIGTNLNQLVQYMHRTGRAEPALASIDAIQIALRDLRREQLALIDRASNRYESEA